MRAADTPIATCFYRWEGDACRIHTEADGKETADLYRARAGLVPIDPHELKWKGTPITAAAFMHLVEREASTTGLPGMAGIVEKLMTDPKTPTT